MKIDDLIINVELERILAKLKQDLSNQGIDLFQKGFKESSGDIMVQCPYHSEGQEKRPSAGIRKSDGQFHCFACGEIHSLPEVISYCFGYDDGGMYGLTWILKNFIAVEKENRKDVELDFKRSEIGLGDNSIHRRSYASSRIDSRFVSEQELDSYRYYHPYMYKRKLTNEIIELFDIGYDKETECITFPVRDIRGNTLFVAKRKVNYKAFFYPAGVEKPLYGIYEIYTSNPLFMPSEVIVCESMLDALTCWVYGKYAVAMNGLGSELQFKQLNELPCRKLILATDNDSAGMKARKKLREKVTNKIITEYLLPEGRKDINELTKEEFDDLQEVF